MKMRRCSAAGMPFKRCTASLSSATVDEASVDSTSFSPPAVGLMCTEMAVPDAMALARLTRGWVGQTPAVMCAPLAVRARRSPRSSPQRARFCVRACVSGWRGVGFARVASCVPVLYLLRGRELQAEWQKELDACTGLAVWCAPHLMHGWCVLSGLCRLGPSGCLRRLLCPPRRHAYMHAFATLRLATQPSF